MLLCTSYSIDVYLGRGQAVRHRVLIPAFAGSNPAGPAIYIYYNHGKS